MSRVVHFEIQANDVERAKAFYAAVFGWSFEDYSGTTSTTYWGIVTGPEDQPGINGGLLERPAPAPGPQQGTNGYVCTVAVGDYDATERRVLDAGGQPPSSPSTGGSSTRPGSLAGSCPARSAGSASTNGSRRSTGSAASAPPGQRPERRLTCRPELQPTAAPRQLPARPRRRQARWSW
jgi:predicted enzyme related to lactoylglutathione lyase